ncbi:uncharacterized protein G2W53_000347 [Senna tora]|uniref:Uncharacterized protein n=1 Tax=Senna tora TaxID=362788 RepID=A0A834XFP4_9FABA|nr:uncharacterized protein G2W53_000347 [Senna tora]
MTLYEDPKAALREVKEETRMADYQKPNLRAIN